MSVQIENRDYETIKFYLSPSFMREKTPFQCLDDFFNTCGMDVHSQESFDAIGVAQLDLIVQNNTKFINFDALMSSALDYSFESQLKKIKF